MLVIFFVFILFIIRDKYCKNKIVFSKLDFRKYIIVGKLFFDILNF